jgi:hypothetical protein
MIGFQQINMADFWPTGAKVPSLPSTQYSKRGVMILNVDEIAPVHPDFEDDMPTIYYV